MRVAIQTDAEKAAEVAMVGWAIEHPNRVLDLDLEGQHFADERLARAWDVIARMADAGEPVTAVTLAKRIEVDRTGDEGAEPILGLVSLLAEAELQAAAFPDKYAAIVRDSWVTRQVLFACSETMEARSRGVESGDLLSLALEKFAAIQVEPADRPVKIGDLVKSRFRRLQEIADAKAKGDRAATGILTGIESLDAVIGGLQREIATVIAGRPAMGKSSVAMTITDNVSAQGIGVHAFNIEDAEDAYADRSLAGRSMVSAERLRSCELERGHLGQLLQAAEELRQRKGWIVESRSRVTAEELVRSVRRRMRENATQVVIVDYVQLLKAPPGTPKQKAFDKTWVAGHAMETLADAAKQDKVSYVVLAQLNRDLEKRPDKRPQLADLKQSGEIEERSKCVLMLYRPAYYGEEDENGQPYPESHLEILVRKNSNGPTGTAMATWDGPTLRVS